MDFTLIASAMSSINVAKEVGRAAIGVRDFNAAAGAISQINDLLLKAQDALFTHNANMAELQQQNFDLRDKVRALEAKAEERGRYQLFEIASGKFVYKAVAAANEGTLGGAIPEHYVCQPCFDKGTKSVLAFINSAMFGPQQCCSVCKRDISVS